MDESIYDRLGVERVTPEAGSRLGIATSTIGLQPINGIRHPIDDDMNGWYVWCGEWSDEDDFFKPLHIEHIGDYLPGVKHLLELPPGYRFLIDDKGYEDVWFDEGLLRV